MVKEKYQNFDRKKYRKIIVGSVTTRILLAPAIFLIPFLATLFTFLIDWADGEFFKRAGFPKYRYDLIDKILDYYWYVFIILFIVINQIPGKTFFYFLFISRTVGQFLYFFTQKEKFLFFFPNVFEVLFYVYILSSVFTQLTEYLFIPKLITLLVIIIPIVLTREYVLHIKKSNLSWFFTGKTTYWIDEDVK